MSEAKRILLFWKDDEDSTKMFSYFFRNHGYIVDSINSYEECVELCLTNPPHVLITSCIFDQSNIALEFIRKLRTYPNLSYVPIIVGEADFADNSEESGHIRFFKAGANACFAHVYDVDDILKQVEILIKEPTKTNLIDKNTALWYGNLKTN